MKIDKKLNKRQREILDDFFQLEIHEGTYSIIYNFLELQNFIEGKFEGNQYLLHKINIEDVVIIDIVSEEFSFDYSQTRVSFKIMDLLKLMNELKF